MADNVFSDADQRRCRAGRQLDLRGRGSAEWAGSTMSACCAISLTISACAPTYSARAPRCRSNYAETAEVAGNVFDRICAQGIDVHGAKENVAATDRPFTRILIHHNKVVDSLINVDDFGGIETWQGGPAYVYDNISGNPGGYRSWDHVLNPNAENRFGHAYYLDGAFKNYYFNNIAWGKSKGPTGKLANTSAFQEIISYQNTFFNNTIYQLRDAARAGRRPRPAASSSWATSGRAWASRLSRRRPRSHGPGRQRGRRRTPPQPVRDRHRTPTRATSSTTSGESFGVIEPSGPVAPDAPGVPRYPGKLPPAGCRRGRHGRAAAPARCVRSRLPAVRQLGRPRAGSEGIRAVEPLRDGRRMELLPHPGRSARILDEHWCMSPYYTGRDNYYKIPTYPLKGVNITLKDYQDGPLENWTTGALHFNGSDQYAVLRNEDICRSVSLERSRTH